MVWKSKEKQGWEGKTSKMAISFMIKTKSVLLGNIVEELTNFFCFVLFLIDIFVHVLSNQRIIGICSVLDISYICLLVQCQGHFVNKLLIKQKNKVS